MRFFYTNFIALIISNIACFALHFILCFVCIFTRKHQFVNRQFRTTFHFPSLPALPIWQANTICYTLSSATQTRNVLSTYAVRSRLIRKPNWTHYKRQRTKAVSAATTWKVFNKITIAKTTHTRVNRKLNWKKYSNKCDRRWTTMTACRGDYQQNSIRGNKIMKEK